MRKTVIPLPVTVLLISLVAQSAEATSLSHQRTLRNVDFTYAGISSLGGTAGGSGTIGISGISGPVTHAFLYWEIRGTEQFNPQITVNNTPVTGTLIGTTPAGRCSSTFTNWRAYEADVTSLVTGDGFYTLGGVQNCTGCTAEGASLVVVYNDGNASNDRDLHLFVGDDPNISTVDDGWHATLAGIDWTGSGSASAIMHVSEGQNFLDAPVTFMSGGLSTTVNDSPSIWDGNSLPAAGNPNATNGGLWDIHPIDITAIMGAAGTKTVQVDGQLTHDDCLNLIAVQIAVPPAALPTPTPTPTPSPTPTPTPTPTPAPTPDCVTTSTCTQPPTGLVAWYPADGNAKDVQGGNDGTLENGTIFSAGYISNAFIFDGTDDQVSVPHNANQNTGSEITIEAWIRQFTVGDGKTIVQKRSASDVGGYALETTHSPSGPANGLAWKIWIGGTSRTVMLPAGTLTLGAWHHIAATYDGFSMKIWVNAVPRASMAVTGAIDSGNDALVLGRNVTNSEAYAGLVDEFSLYNRALTASEILTLYRTGNAGKCKTECVAPPSNAVGWYTGDGNANDISVLANHATLQGGAGYAPGMVGQAFSLDGASFAEAPANPAQDPATTGSHAAWVHFHQLPSVAGRIMEIIGKGSGGNDFDLQVNQDNVFRFYIAGGHNVASTTGIQTCVWYHVAATWDATGLRMYVNGVLESTNPVQNLTRGQSHRPLQIGHQPWFPGRFFDGLIDEAQTFDRRLTDEEIAAMANASSGGQCRVLSAPPRITSVRRTAGGKVLEGVGTVGAVYTVRSTDDLLLPFDNVLGTTTVNEAGIFLFEDTPPVGVTQRFYRVSSP